MVIKTDGRKQSYVAWSQGPHGFKRAWIQHRTGSKDWAGTGRYINVVRTKALDSPPAGNGTDFPIFSHLPDNQALISFVVAVCGVTGCPVPR